MQDMDTKHKQLIKLQEVREAAVQSHTECTKMTSVIDSAVTARYGPRQTTARTHFSRTDSDTSQSYPEAPCYYQLNSAAESTLNQYTNPNPRNTVTPYSSRQVKLFNSMNGQQFPINHDTGHVSKFPQGFRGCYFCGETHHFKDCQHRITNPNATFLFHQEYSLTSHTNNLHLSSHLWYKHVLHPILVTSMRTHLLHLPLLHMAANTLVKAVAVT